MVDSVRRRREAEGLNRLILRDILGVGPDAREQVEQVERVLSMFSIIFTSIPFNPLPISTFTPRASTPLCGQMRPDADTYADTCMVARRHGFSRNHGLFWLSADR